MQTAARYIITLDRLHLAGQWRDALPDQQLFSVLQSYQKTQLAGQTQKFSLQNIFHQVSAAHEKLSNTLTNPQDNSKQYFDKKVQTLLSFIIGQQVYACRSPLASLDEEKRNTKGKDNPFSCTKGGLTVVNVKSHAITTDENSIPDTISIDKAAPERTKDHVTTRVAPSLDPPARTAVERNTGTERKEPLESVADEVVYRYHTSACLISRVRWYGYTPEENTRDLAYDIPRHFINQCLNWDSKSHSASWVVASTDKNNWNMTSRTRYWIAQRLPSRSQKTPLFLRARLQLFFKENT